MEVAGESIRVQKLAQSGLSEVPPEYIQPPQKRCLSSHQPSSDLNIPAIDLFGFNPNLRDSVRDEIGRACRDWGAFHVINHGVPCELLDEIRSVGLSFFNDCPVNLKLSYACDSSSSFASEGYGSRMLLRSDEGKNDTVLDWRDYFDHHTLPISRRNPSRWPHTPANYRSVVVEYGDQMKILSQKLLAFISESLGLKSSSIEDAVGDIYQNITISYYPSCPQPELTLGLQPHSDFGAITLLIQDDVAGLQVLKDEDWITVHPLEDAIVVILADQTEIITNGKYRSSQHRAITNARKARLSVATFHDPAKDVKISPASELVSESSPPRYNSVIYGDYVSSWYTMGPEGKRNIDALLC